MKACGRTFNGMKIGFALATACCLALPLAAADSAVQQIPGAYEARLSGWCRSVSELNTVAGLAGDFRVRRGGSLSASGNRHNIFVDDGGEAYVTGQASTIFVAKGGRATVGGERNQVFSEQGARVIVIGQARVAAVGEFDLKVNRNGSECQ
jgi:hypothetical protein